MDAKYIKKTNFGDIQWIKKITPNASCTVTKWGEIEFEPTDIDDFLCEAQLSMTNVFEATEDEFLEMYHTNSQKLNKFIEL